jgi:hypothetical protein
MSVDSNSRKGGVLGYPLGNFVWDGLDMDVAELLSNSTANHRSS